MSSINKKAKSNKITTFVEIDKRGIVSGESTSTAVENMASGEYFRSFESHKNDESKSFGKTKERGEFPESVQGLIDKGINSNLNRKSFLTLMGASIAMAGVSCTRRPVEKIVPYLNRPVGTVPGVPIYYATSYHDSNGVLPMLVKTREGKPIKIEPMDEHPVTKGAMTANGFATIWDLYDPDRLKAPRTKLGSTMLDSKWSDAIAGVQKELKASKKIAIISNLSFSPSDRLAIDQFKSKYKNTTEVVYDSGADFGEVIAGEKLSYGSSSVPSYRFDKADLILSVDADFLGTWLDPATFTKQFSSRRNPELGNKMTRLISVEAMMSLTGANADTRMPLKQGTQVAFLLGLANIIAPSAVTSAYSVQKVSSLTGLSVDQIQSVAKELKAKAGRSLVVAGGTSTKNEIAGSAQVAANLLNSILGNEGKSVSSKAELLPNAVISSEKQVLKIIKDIDAGKFDTVIINNANPVFDLPSSLKLAEALKNAKNVVFVGYHFNETAKYANTLLAQSHPLEAWSDSLSNGVYGVTQPVIESLFDSKSLNEIWLSLSGSKTTDYQFVKNQAKSYVGAGWNKALQKGFVLVEAKSAGGSRNFNAAAVRSIKAPLKSSGKYTLGFYKSIQILDGQGGNIAYRQELSDPVTKITWENYLAVSPIDAKKNDWSTGTKLEVKAKGYSAELPVFVQPGLAQGTMAVAIGYGHDHFGQIANDKGFKANNFANISKNSISWNNIAVEVKDTGSSYMLATTQYHNAIEDTVSQAKVTDRVSKLTRSAELSEFKKNKKAGNEFEVLPGKGLYAGYEYKGYRWGMNIDLSKCTGCSACVTSCNSENNVPAVGKSEVYYGREMAWIRIDRYYKGDVNNPEVLFQPMMCQHCENAPCENVCPVLATTHDEEGLNNMTYNRCIGTRYCANDCPFKVRRFNWFENWEGKVRDPQHYAINPDVTVRSRGVIEKCSFCVQRIAERKQAAKLDNRKVKDGELRTACQQGCPAEAISFGDINDKNSVVSKLNKNTRSYRMLDELLVKSSIHYMVKIRKDEKA